MKGSPETGGHGGGTGARAATVAFVVAITLSATLLFMVQPMITKMLLPRFGGSAAVWSVAMVFFQAALLAGYFYAHMLTRWLAPVTAAGVHLVALLAGLVALPFAIGAEGQGGSTGNPSLGVLLALAGAVGLPFTALAANAPLLQAWYARSPLAGAANPYPLYAASNAGSLSALVAYPFLIEPAAALRGQSLGWTIGYGALVAVIALAVFLARPRAGQPAPPVRMDRRWLVWAALGLVPSAALVAVTAHISSDVAAAPFLWVAPLALYLLTFVLAFGSRAQAWLRGAQMALPVLLVAVAVTQGFKLRLGLVPDVALHLATFTAIALVFHGLLAQRRPAAEALTGFYLALSVGGLIGGVAAALVAPALFSFVAEYPLVLVAASAGALLPFVTAPLVAGLLVLPALLWPQAQESVMRRSFYGVHRMEVTPDGQFRILRHGQEIHGAIRLRQADGAAVTGRPQPLTYYHEEGALSWAIDAARDRKGAPARIGVVGLGAGSTACLTNAGDTIDFYEIDPEIIRIARDPKLFGFLAGCAPDAAIIEGDARLTLGRSSAQYDVLVIDAFSSDAIPAHLLTREAFRTYMQRVAPGGMLVMHISNDHLRLNDIVAATARSEGLLVRIYDEFAEEDAEPLVFQPTLAAIARTEADFGELAASSEWPRVDATPDAPVWTDDFSNLLSAIIAKARED